MDTEDKDKTDDSISALRHRIDFSAGYCTDRADNGYTCGFSGRWWRLFEDAHAGLPGGHADTYSSGNRPAGDNNNR